MSKNNLKRQDKVVEAAAQEQELDGEWVRLMQNAREIGMGIDDIRRFLREAAASARHDVNV